MALYVAPAGTPQPVLDAVSITGPFPLSVDFTAMLPLPIEQGPLAIVIEAPVKGMVSVGYSFCLHAEGGTPPYTWTIPAGSLPAGLTLTPGGHIAGTPTTQGGSTAVFLCTDAVGDTDTEAFGFVILPLPSKGITEVESTDGSITVTNGTGPIVDLATAGGSVLPYNSEVLTSNVPFTGTNVWVEFLETDLLDVGTWLIGVTADINILGSGIGDTYGWLTIVEGTATATIDGPFLIKSPSNQSPVYVDEIIGLTCLVKVTVKGTMSLQAKCDASNYWSSYVAEYSGAGGAPSTHYTAVRISPSAS
jgi:hypothetical protein